MGCGAAGGRREGHHEPCAAGVCVSYFDFSAVRADDVGRHGEPDPASGDPAGRAAAPEPLEHAVRSSAGMPGTAVGDGEARRSVRRIGHDLDPAARRSELDRVAQRFATQLSEPGPVAHDGRGSESLIELQRLCVQAGPERLDLRAGQRGELHRRAIDDRHRHVGVSQGIEILDQRAEPQHLFVEGGKALRRGLRDLVDELLEVPLQDRDRSPDFVGRSLIMRRRELRSRSSV